MRTSRETNRLSHEKKQFREFLTAVRGLLYTRFIYFGLETTDFWVTYDFTNTIIPQRALIKKYPGFRGFPCLGYNLVPPPECSFTKRGLSPGFRVIKLNFNVMN